MALEAKIYDAEESPAGKSIPDLPDHFLSVAIAHANKSPSRYSLLSRVAPVGVTTFVSMDRERLKQEWLMLESLAIGSQERAKWQAIFKALIKNEAFQSLQFVGN